MVDENSEMRSDGHGDGRGDGNDSDCRAERV